MKKLAVLILNYNGKGFLKKCYASLLNQTSKDFDVYLVDNNSMDDSRVFTREKFPSIKVINTGNNLGYTGAYNHTIKIFERQNLNYSCYLFLNNDTECDKKMVEEINRVFDWNTQVGVVVPAIVDKKMVVDSVGGKLLFFSGTTLGYKHGRMYTRKNSLFRCFWASGSALAIRADLFKELGGFPNYFMYFEDLDLSWRVNNAGYLVLATQRTFVKHLQGGTPTPSNFKLYLSERNRIFCYWRNLPNIIFFLTLPILVLIRIGLVFYQTKSLSNLQSKLKGIFNACINLFKSEKRLYTFSAHIKTILQSGSVSVITKPAD